MKNTGGPTATTFAHDIRAVRYAIIILGSSKPVGFPATCTEGTSRAASAFCEREIFAKRQHQGAHARRSRRGCKSAGSGHNPKCRGNSQSNLLSIWAAGE